MLQASSVLFALRWTPPSRFVEIFMRAQLSRVIRSLSFAAAGSLLAACSTPTDGGVARGGEAGADADLSDGAGDGGGDSGDAGSTASADGGPGYLTTCTMLGTPGDCPAGYMLTCRSFPNKGENLCTHPCSLGCPPPSKGCSAGSGMCAGPP